MRNVKFKYLKAKNILCFGEDPLIIDFENLDNIILILGKNLDNSDNEEDNKESSNGSGKSSIADCISYALYGKTIKKQGKINHNDVIHNQAKELYVELIINDYKIIRTRKENKGTLDIWQLKDKWIKLTRSKPAQMQELINNDIIGINYETFINVFIFADDSSKSFLESDTPTKRLIIENLLSLEIYRSYHESAKEFLKTNKESLKTLEKDHEILTNSLESCNSRLEKIELQEKEWQNQKIIHIDRIKKKINEINQNDNIEKYKQAQIKINILNKELNELEKTKSEIPLKDINSKSEIIRKQYSAFLDNLSEIERNIKNSNCEITKHNAEIGKIGQKCPVCNEIIKAENLKDVIKNSNNIILEENNKLLEFESKKEELKDNINKLLIIKEKFDNNLKEYQVKIINFDKRIKEINGDLFWLIKVKEPDNSLIKNLEEQISNKLNEINPYLSILDETKEEIREKEKEISVNKEKMREIEEDLPYYQFLCVAFSDDGLRSFVIDSVVPILNERIEYWLELLVNGKIKLTFDNKLDETVDRFPFNKNLKFVYSGLSNGQRRKLILALSQAFSYIMMMSAGVSLNVLFLDEASQNLDGKSVEAIFKLILELSKEKQVFVIDHNENLKNMLNYDKIYLEMKDGVSRRIDKLE